MIGRSDRDELRTKVEEWLRRHDDPADPLTMPVELLLAMFLAGTDRHARMISTVGAILLGAVIIAGTQALIRHSSTTVVMTRADEARVMQQWIDSHEAVRVMRCEGDGLEFTGGRCHTIAGGGWLIPLAAQQALAAPRTVPSAADSTRTASPWGR